MYVQSIHSRYLSRSMYIQCLLETRERAWLERGAVATAIGQLLLTTTSTSTRVKFQILRHFFWGTPYYFIVNILACRVLLASNSS